MTDPSLTLIVDGNPERPGLDRALTNLVAWASKRGVACLISRANKSLVPRTKGKSSIQYFTTIAELRALLRGRGDLRGLVVAMGGDGSLLHAVGRYHALEFPVLSVNLGSVGFNASIGPAGLVAMLEAWRLGKAAIAERMLLRVRRVSGKRTIKESVALNDVALLRQTRSRMIQAEIHREGAVVLACHTDGVIVSTPTGSTAYNLATGGPIVHPELEALTVSLLGAHSLSSRAIVLPPSPPLELSWVSRPRDEQPALTIDGREHWDLSAGDRIVIERAESPLRLLRPPGKGSAASGEYFQTLREKLGWNVPIRRVAVKRKSSTR